MPHPSPIERPGEKCDFYIRYTISCAIITIAVVFTIRQCTVRASTIVALATHKKSPIEEDINRLLIGI